MAKKQENTVTVKAAAHLSENGTHYNPGETFETTPERADSLGALVEIVPAS